MSDGFVQALWRFPVLGMAGEQLRSSQVDTRGVAGDRQHFLSGDAEGRLGIQDLPGLARWTASYPFNPDGAIQPDKPPPFPMLAAPGGVKSWRWADPRLGFALERDLGRSVEMVRDLDATRGVVVATVKPESPLRIAGVNIQLSLDLPGGFAGVELIFRDGVRLALVASRADGPGIEARVIEAGRVVVGEPVTLG